MLTLQYIPYHEIESMDSNERVKYLLKIVKQEKIILLEGKLRKTEEANLIQKTMESITPAFKGIEIATISPEQGQAALLKKIKTNLINALLGDRQGITIVGPATVVSEIKQDPHKIQLLLNEGNKKRKRR